jgi:exodeoxyribonuclease VII large subunit
MFANRNSRARFKPADGQQVIVRGHLSLYQGRGDFQAIVEHMEPAGAGALRAAYEQLRMSLAAEGLFDDDRKQQLLAYPEHIGIVSSASGAALQDVLAVLARRYPIAAVTVIPALVQGPGAEEAIIRALHRAAEINADLIILTRGGGSLEDLWAFNLASVVRAVAASPIPIISAIGHETDVTLTDFAADLRAPTPSVAAEVATPDKAELLRTLRGIEQTLINRLQQRLQAQQLHLARTRKRLVPPQRVLQQLMQRADQSEMRLRSSSHQLFARLRQRLASSTVRLHATAPDKQLKAHRVRRSQLQQRLLRAQHVSIGSQRSRFENLTRALNAVSPLATLERGFAIVMSGPTTATQPWGSPLSRAEAAKPGQELLAHLADGTLVCTVNEQRPSPVQLSTK